MLSDMISFFLFYLITYYLSIFMLLNSFPNMIKYSLGFSWGMNKAI
jgi:hypothetical protein